MNVTMCAVNDTQLQHNVQDELSWDPRIQASKIGVAVNDGVVTLTGTVDSLFEKWEAESAVKRVRGVRALANDLEVKLPTDGRRNDTEIARAAADALAWNAAVPRDRLSVSVSDGEVTIEGEVEWRYQKLAAADAVRSLLGVRGVDNQIEIKPRVSPQGIKDRIDAALLRNARLNAHQIHVSAEGGWITLTGDVHSWAEHEEAERAAWAVPGVYHVDNRLSVTLS